MWRVDSRGRLLLRKLLGLGLEHGVRWLRRMLWLLTLGRRCLLVLVLLRFFWFFFRFFLESPPVSSTCSNCSFSIL